MQTKKIIGIALAAALVSSMAAVAATSVSAVDVLDENPDLSAHKVGIIGGFNGWADDVATMTDTDGDGVYVGVVANVPAGDTEFKIRLDGAWDYSWGDYEADYDRTFNSQTNCKISTTEATDVVVLLDTNGEDGNLWPVKYFTVANKGGNTNEEFPGFNTLGAIGGFNEWGGDAAMTEVAPGVYAAAIGDLAKGTEFKVRADGAWDLSWGAYEAEYERTQNSQTNCAMPEDGKNVTVFLDTNGDDFELWPVLFTYTNADGQIVVVDTSVETTPEESKEESKEESTEESKEESKEESTEESKEESTEEPSEESKEESTIPDYYITQTKDYVFFDNSQTKWDKVYAYWWNADLGETYDKLTKDEEGNPAIYPDYDRDENGEILLDEDGNRIRNRWPGVAMEQVEGTDIWQVRVPYGATNIIFNSGVSDADVAAGTEAYQTADMKFNSDENAGQIYTIDTSVEPKAGRGVEKTKFRYSEGAWTDYEGEYNEEELGEAPVDPQDISTPDDTSDGESTTSTTTSTTGTTSTVSTVSNTSTTTSTTSTTSTTKTGTTSTTSSVDAPATGDVAMAAAFIAIAAAALGAVVLASKKRRV